MNLFCHGCCPSLLEQNIHWSGTQAEGLFSSIVNEEEFENKSGGAGYDYESLSRVTRIINIAKQCKQAS